MNWEPVVWVAIIGAVATAIGYLVKYLGDNSASKTSAKTNREQRLDDRMDSYTSRIENRLEKVEEDAEEATKKAKALEIEKEAMAATVREHERKISELHGRAAISDRREALLYFHTKALRDHILLELPPPPPLPPQELLDWFADFEDTLPPASLQAHA